MAIIVITVLVGGIAGLKSSFRILTEGFFSKPEEQVASAPEDPAGPPLLFANAFKAGHGLSQMKTPQESEAAFEKWRNRVVAHVEALGLDATELRELDPRARLSEQQAALIEDRIRTGLEARNGAETAATFVVGAQLEPVVDALSTYLSDAEYRARLEEQGRHIGQLAAPYNECVEDAHLPARVSGTWKSIFKGALNASGDDRLIAELSLWYRDCILAYYYDWLQPPGGFTFVAD